MSISQMYFNFLFCRKYLWRNDIPRNMIWESRPQPVSILFNEITLPSIQLKFPSSLLVVDFILTPLIFHAATMSHLFICYYVAHKVLKSVKYKSSVLKAILSKCYLSHHRCWLSRSLSYSHLIPAWTKLNSKAGTCYLTSL